jgi:hypothetical protein
VHGWSMVRVLLIGGTTWVALSASATVAWIAVVHMARSRFRLRGHNPICDGAWHGGPSGSALLRHNCNLSAEMSLRPDLINYNCLIYLWGVTESKRAANALIDLPAIESVTRRVTHSNFVIG